MRLPLPCLSLFSQVVGWLGFFCEHITTHDLELVLAT